ncbi:MAG: glycosyltransferase family 1 protein [Patescibacteria group bacterium]|jgi:glycosyltransferase involved in cell wall biosynthesis
MNIGVDARSLLVEKKEGMHVYATNVLRQWAKSAPDHNFVLYVDGSVSAELRSQFPSNFRLVILTPKHFWPQTRLTWHFLLTRGREFDVFYFPTQSMSLYCPKPTLAVIHDLAFIKFPNYFTAWNRFVLANLTTNFTVKHAQKMICISQQTKRDVMGHYHVPEDKLEVIYHGYDQEQFFPRSPDEITVAKKQFGITGRYLIYLGTLQKRKNIVRLIEAYAQLRADKQLEHQLVIAGKRGWLYKDIFETVQKLHLEPYVVFTDYMPTATAASLYSGSEAYILPSLYEGFGMPVIEAMACGAPVIVSSAPPLPEIAGSAAEIINDPYRSESIATAIWNVISNPKRQQDLKSAGLVQKNNYSWSKCAQATLAAILSLRR